MKGGVHTHHIQCEITVYNDWVMKMSLETAQDRPKTYTDWTNLAEVII